MELIEKVEMTKSPVDFYNLKEEIINALGKKKITKKVKEIKK